MVYLHPVLGALTVALTLWLASQGLRARHKASYARNARKSHGTVAPWLMVLCWVTLLFGVGSTALLREDLTPAQSAHGAVGLALALCMVGLWLLSRRFGTPANRMRHLWLGLTSVVAAVAVAVLGMRLLP